MFKKKANSEGLKKLQRGIQHEKYVVALGGGTFEDEKESAVMDEKFAVKQDRTDQLINEATTGRQTLQDYKRKRMRIELEMGMPPEEAEEKKRKKQAKEAEDALNTKETKKLSFKYDDDDDDENSADEIKLIKPASKFKRGKDPSVNTDFLPDKDRDDALLEETQKQRAQWLDAQERLKEELFTIDYCFYDGTSQRKSMKLRKGETVRYFLDEARLHFPELKGVSLNDLMFIKDHFYVPDHYTFYELMEMPGKDPKQYDTLARWTEAEQVKVKQLGVQTTQTVRIVQRHFYEKNYASHPFTNWVQFSVDEGPKKIPIYNTQNNTNNRNNNYNKW